MLRILYVTTLTFLCLSSFMWSHLTLLTIRQVKVAMSRFCVVFPCLKTNSGRKKLKQVESEIQRLTSVQHPNVVRTLAVKLYLPNSNSPSQLTILCEQSPALTLQDVLEDCDSLRGERASVSFSIMLILGQRI